MKKKSIFVCFLAASLLVACGSNSSQKSSQNEEPDTVATVSEEDSTPDQQSTTDEETATKEESDKSTEDWDSVLDSYEEYVDKYISYAKKAQNGDVNAITEMTSLMESAQELGDKLENASDEMSAKQAARYTKITSKMASIAM